MAIHDLWSYDNSPQSTTDISAGTSLSYPNNGTYNSYTGLPGVLYKNTGGTGTITSDGYLNLISSASWNPALVIRQNDVQNWSTSTQWWIGFRTKIVGTQSASSTKIFTIGDSLAQSNNVAILSESDMTTAGYATIGTAYYVEVFIDKTNLVYQVYVNGISIKSGTLVAAVVPSGGTGYYFWGGLNSASATANATRSFRDYYFLDVDATDTGRLGPIASSPAALASASGSEWTLNGSPSSLLVALNTPLQSPPVTTPSASAPADNQQLQVALSTSIASTTPIIAVQGQLTLGGDAAINILDMSLTQGGQTADVGRVPALVSSTQYNQRWPSIIRKAPDSGLWTPAKVNATNLNLTPSKTILLMHFDGTNGSTTTTDASGVNSGFTFKGTTQISTAQSKFGGSSLFPNSASAGGLSIPDGTWLRFSADCTIECWVYSTSTSQNGVIFGKDLNSSSFAELQYYQNTWKFYLDGNTNPSITASANLTLNTWYHIAVVRYGGVWYLYQNGVLMGQVSGGNVGVNNTNPFVIGNWTGLTAVFLGYIDEFRISNVARYTAAFTPPSAAFTPD